MRVVFGYTFLVLPPPTPQLSDTRGAVPKRYLPDTSASGVGYRA